MGSEKRELMKRQKPVEYRGRTSNGYFYHINKDGEAAIYCRHGERYAKSDGLKKAVHEILDGSRAAKRFVWQWYTIPIYNN